MATVNVYCNEILAHMENSCQFPHLQPSHFTAICDVHKKEKMFSFSSHTLLYEMMWKEIKFAFFALSLTQYSLSSIVLIQKVSFRLQRKGEFFFTFSSREHTQSGNMPSSNISEAESYSRKYTIASTGVESKKKKFEMRLRGRR